MRKQMLIVVAAVILFACKKPINEPGVSDERISSQKEAKVSNTPWNANPILKDANTDFEIGAAVNAGKFNKRRL